jgi:subtilisin family serine protease
MATVYVICADLDLDALRARVLQSLPSHGYSHWLTRQADLVAAVESCQATLVLVTAALLDSSAWLAEVKTASEAAAPLICVLLAGSARERMPEYLKERPLVDFTAGDDAGARRELVDLLPPAAAGPASPAAQPIEWNEESFSAALERATSRHEHARLSALLEAFEQHARERAYAYPEQHAFANLQALRRARAFELMRRLAAAVVSTGTRQDRVLRLYAQALIETRAYPEALENLRAVIGSPESSAAEVFEARGLVGRVYKQRFVEADASDHVAANWLLHAIAAYEEAYMDDPQLLWHGINAATCLQRFARDFGAVPSLPADYQPPQIKGRPIRVTGAGEQARNIAQQVLEQLKAKEQHGPLDLWDSATRVEALIVMDAHEEAARALQRYIHHPDMDAFAASSTLRQLEQLLQLSKHPVLEPLRATVERYRAGGIEAAHGGEVRPLVIRLRDPEASLEGIASLKLQHRLGSIVTAQGSDASVRELLDNPAVISVEQSRPAGRAECVRSLPFINVGALYPSVTGPFAETGDAALVAVIDGGIDVLHQAFLDANGASRIVGVWDQNTQGTPPAGFTYGQFHDAAAIAAAVQAGRQPQGLPLDVDGHGTHVASIAAGRKAGEFSGGVATDAKLLVVISAANSPIGYSQTHIEALSFIDAFATKLGLPVVVNVSQGMNAGAHDGKSALEAAFDEFTQSGRKAGRVIVKSAGNERGKGGHAKVTLQPGSLEALRWQRKQGADPRERMELWWSSADEVEFRLRDPGGTWTDWVGMAAPELEAPLPGGPSRLVFTRRHVDNGDSLLAIEVGGAGRPAALGEWKLEIRSGTNLRNGDIHAWIERTQGTPSTYLDHVDENMTLSIPATAASVIAVGAVDASRPIRVGDFSSYGPTRDGQEKPVVGAPGVQVRAARGGTPDQALVQSGTSMAAPHVAGAIALLLSRTSKSGRSLGSNQIASVLKQKTQNHSGKWDRGQGWGVIDVAALLAAF